MSSLLRSPMEIIKKKYQLFFRDHFFVGKNYRGLPIYVESNFPVSPIIFLHRIPMFLLFILFCANFCRFFFVIVVNKMSSGNLLLVKQPVGSTTQHGSSMPIMGFTPMSHLYRATRPPVS